MASDNFKVLTGITVGDTPVITANGTWVGTGIVQSFNGMTGNVALSSANVVSALAYTPANKAGDTFVGTVAANSIASNTVISISGATLSTNTFTTSSTSQVTVDSFATTDFRSAKYMAQMSSGSDYHAIELFVLHNGTTSYMNEYGEIYTNSSLGDFETSITSGNVNLLFTATNSTTRVDLFRTAVNNVAPPAAPTTTYSAGMQFDIPGITFDTTGYLTLDPECFTSPSGLECKSKLLAKTTGDSFDISSMYSGGSGNWTATLTGPWVYSGGMYFAPYTAAVSPFMYSWTITV